MSELLPEAGRESEPVLTPEPDVLESAILNRRAILATYIDTLAPHEKVRAQKHAKDMFEQGGPLSKFVVLTPIAAHQEQPETLLHAMGEYAKQKEAGAFTIVLGLNYPSSHSDSQLVPENRQAIEDARRLYPTLDIRTFEQAYPGKTNIGRIRRDVWNSAVALAVLGNETDDSYLENLGLNQDIDLITLSPHFIRSAKEAMMIRLRDAVTSPDDFYNGTAPLPFHSNGKHAYDPRFPNTSHAVFWREFILRHFEGNSFEAGTLIPFVSYANSGGISPNKRTAEIITLLKKTGKSYPEKIAYTSLDTVYSETNVRRYVERLHDHSFSDMWEPDSFTQFNEYREADAPLTDISPERLEELVVLGWPHLRDFLLETPIRMINWGPYSEAGIERVRELTERELNLAVRVLERVMHLPDFAKSVEREKSYLPRVYAHAYKRALGYHKELADEVKRWVHLETDGTDS